MDTSEKKALAAKVKKKKKTPSTLRRNAKRREEFLKKKLETSTGSEHVSVEEAVAKQVEEVLVEHTTDGSDALEKGSLMCDQCENVFHSEKGLKIHKGKVHKSSIFPPLEVFRDTEFTKPLEVSPLKEVREDLCDDSAMEKNPGQGKSKVSLNPEQRAMFGHMFKMYQTQNVPKS